LPTSAAASAMQRPRTGKGDVARAQTDGEADPLRAKWETEATYHANVAAFLMPMLIQQQYFVRRNGQLPQYILGEGNTASSSSCPAAS
jgi:hypothetical protein